VSQPVVFKTGGVKVVRVGPGEAVEKGQVLVEFE
jgi:biotin carboxyl carrier protein